MTDLTSPAFKRICNEATENLDNFWNEEAKKVNWFRNWSRVFDWNPPNFRWFDGAVTNLSYNCLDEHLERGFGNHTALIYENERGDKSVYTYSQLLAKVRMVASSLRAIGVTRGDRVAIYMPTNPEAIISMLAATRIGAIHLVVFAGFGSTALAERVRLSGANVLVAADMTWRRGKEVDLWSIVKDALENFESPIQKLVLFSRKSSLPNIRRVSLFGWPDFLENGKGYPSHHEPIEANEPAFILATSGTTAKPKLAVHVHGGYQVWLRSTGDWVYGFRQSDVWWSTSDIGWIVGHSYIVYAPLLFGCTTIAYEGALDHPGPETFYRILEQNGVTGIFTAPTAVRLMMRYGADISKSFNLTKVERVFCAGEVLNPPAWKWLQKEVFEDRIPVIDHMWQTETGGPIVANPYGIGILPIKPGSATLPLPGVCLEVRTNEGQTCDARQKGLVVLTRPFPGLTPALWGDTDRYKNDYWERMPGLYFTGDAGYIDEDGYVWFSGRADEIIKIGAHRIGTIEVESALLSHRAVAEAGVTGRPDELRGEVISAFVVLRSGFESSPELKKELLETVRRQIGPIVVIGEINFVTTLPKTRSGKIMRRVFKAVVLDRDPGDISTIEDEGSVDEARQAWITLKQHLKEHSS